MILTEPDTHPQNRPPGPPPSADSVAAREPSPVETPRRAEILLVTDDVSMVYSLRWAVAGRHLDVLWTNNFWVAMSYLHDHSFASLVVDLRVESVEEKYLLHFVEEYEQRSRGRKVFLAGSSTSPVLKRIFQEQNLCLLEDRKSIRDLVRALALER